MGNYDYENLIKEENELYERLVFLSIIFNYKLDYIRRTLEKCKVDIKKLYDLVLEDNPFSKRSEFYSLFPKEKKADNFWIRFVDNYYSYEYIRKEINNEKISRKA